jgi:hypothetical protein
MKSGLLPLLVALGVAAGPMPALAQAGTPASAPSPGRPPPGPKPIAPVQEPMTPSEQREAATSDLRPERPLNPQLSFPLGVKSDTAVPSKTAAVRGGKEETTGGGINDAAARCRAQASSQARAACLDELARGPKPR